MKIKSGNISRSIIGNKTRASLTPVFIADSTTGVLTVLETFDSGDRLIKKVSNSNGLSDIELSVTGINEDEVVTIISLNPDIATIDNTNHIVPTYQNYGIAKFIITSSGKVSKSIKINIDASAIAPYLIEEMKPGSLAKHCDDFARSVIAGKSATWDQALFPNQKLFLPNGNRNPDHILSSVDLTCINIPKTYDFSGGYFGTCGTLITPKHILTAAHWKLPVGQYIDFMDNSNQKVTRQIVEGRQIYGTRAGQPVSKDIYIQQLNAPLPPTIKPAKVFPKNISNWFPQRDNSIGVGGISIMSLPDRPGFLAFLCFSSIGNIHVGAYSKTIAEESLSYSINTSKQKEITKWFVDEDYGSGSPVFTVVNGDVVVLGELHMAGFAGPDIPYYYDEINTAISNIPDNEGYQLTPVDLSGFPTY